MTLLNLDNISKSYEGHEVLRNISLSIDEKEFVCVTGASGCGKSTLLNILGMIEKPDSGTYEAFGVKQPYINKKECRRLLRYEISYLFQNFALIPGQTVKQNLEIALRFSQKSKAEKDSLMDEALERVRLPGFKEKKVYQLSGGEQQRVAMARIMLKPSRVVLADEPTGSLDIGNRDLILSILKKMNETDNKSIIVVTHDPNVVSYAQKVITL